MIFTILEQYTFLYRSDGHLFLYNIYIYTVKDQSRRVFLNDHMIILVCEVV